MKRCKLIKGAFFTLITVMFLSALLGSPCFAVEEEKPERLITMAAEFPGIIVPTGEDVTMDIIFYNKGKRDEDVNILGDIFTVGSLCHHRSEARQRIDR